MLGVEEQKYLDEKFAALDKSFNDRLILINQSLDEVKNNIKEFEGFQREVIDKQARYDERMGTICRDIDSLRTEIRENTSALWNHVRKNLPDETEKKIKSTIEAMQNKRDLKTIIAIIGGASGLVAFIKSFF